MTINIGDTAPLTTLRDWFAKLAGATFSTNEEQNPLGAGCMHFASAVIGQTTCNYFGFCSTAFN